METLLQDLRYGIRMLIRNPGFTAVAALSLASGIGANTAIFSIINSILYKPLPYREPERLVQCYWQWARGEIPGATALQFVYWKKRSRSFEDAAAHAFTGAGFNLAGGAEPQRVRGMRVSESFLRVLGVNLAMGRSFSPEEDCPSGPQVVIISDGLWRRYFGADPTIIGKPIRLNDQSSIVVGVLPPGFQFETTVDVLAPLQLKADPRDQGHNIRMIARLKPKVSLQQAQAEMDNILPQLRSEFPNHISSSERGIRLVPYHRHIVGDVGKTLWLLFGAVAFVLLIACANVANLLLALLAARSGEMATRIALGADRWRLVGQLLTESLLLALPGGIAGLLVAKWSVPVLLALSPQELPRLGEIGVDYRAAAFAVCASVMTSLLFGTAPALQATRLNVSESLKASSGRHSTGKLDSLMRSLLVVSEFALALVLLAGTGLLVKTFLNLRAVDIGFSLDNLITMQMSLNSEKYRTTAQAWNFQQQVLERISTLPGVVSAATVPSLPLERGLNFFITLEGRAEPTGRSVECRTISPEYFRTMGIPVLRGRSFTDAERQGSILVVIINENLARAYWADREPLGDQVRLGEKRYQIVGVARDIKEMGLDQAVAPTVYMPMAQVPDSLSAAMNRWFLTSWIVRTAGPADLSASLRNIVKEVDPQMPIARIRPMTEVISSSIASRQFILLLMGGFACLALILTAVGIYGVLSYQVSRRTQEIGIRMALGAQAGDALKLVVGQGMQLALIGVAIIGLAAALALTRLMSSFLFEVSAPDPTTFAVISFLLIGVVLLAGYIPARRATKIDPIVALRYE